jgi:hypothetical protein
MFDHEFDLDYKIWGRGEIMSLSEVFSDTNNNIRIMGIGFSRF